MNTLLCILPPLALVSVMISEWEPILVNAQPTKIKHFWCAESVVELTESLKATIPIDTEAVDLSDCHLNTSIPDHFFSGLPNLRGIIIRKSNIRIITGKTFAGLHSLQFIDLTGSRIMSIEPGAFDGLTKLTKLYLGGIPLDNIPPGLFNSLPNLTSWVRPDGIEVRIHDTMTNEITTIGDARSSTKTKTTTEPDASEPIGSEDGHYKKTATVLSIVFPVVVVILVIIMTGYVCWSLKHMTKKRRFVNPGQSGADPMNSTGNAPVYSSVPQYDVREMKQMKPSKPPSIFDSGTWSMNTASDTASRPDVQMASPR